MRIHLLTCSGHAGLAPDDRHLLHALRARGVEVEPVIWEDPLVDFGCARVTVVRSTWDYTFRRREFLDVLARVAAASTLVNSLDVVAWSSHKQYLLDLASARVAIVPTTLVRRGSAFDLAAHVDERGWPEIVVKPAVGAAGRWTRRFAIDEPEGAAAFLERVLVHEDALVQPLVPSIEDEGELSVVCVEGRVTHAVRKRGAEGDFRIHSDHGGSVEPVDVPHDVAALVDAALAAAPAPTTYARVDVVRGLDDEPCVMELELVEPELFFGSSRAGTQALADALLVLGAD